jgi:spore germination protein GerM
MVRQGVDPLGLMRAQPAAETAGSGAARPRPAVTTGTREITLYFARTDGQSLQPEPRRIEVTTSTVENCRNALRELVKGPARTLAPVLPANVTVRALYLLNDGELVVDFSRELQPESARERSAAVEALMVYGVTNTLTQPDLRGAEGPAVRRVRFLVEGEAPPESYPAHLDLSLPAGPALHWVAAGGRTGND